MLIDFRRTRTAADPINILGEEVELVDTNRYLVVVIQVVPWTTLVFVVQVVPWTLEM